MLPCAACGAHLRSFLRRADLEAAAASRSSLERLLVRAHDAVRLRTLGAAFEAFDAAGVVALYGSAWLPEPAPLWLRGPRLRR